MKWFLEFTFQNMFTFFGMIVLIAITTTGIADICKSIFKRKSNDTTTIK